MNFCKICIPLLLLNLIACKKETHPDLTIVNFDNIEEQRINNIKSWVENEFKIDTITIINKSLPNSAYYKPRNRYRADKLIKYLKDEFNSEKVIGITDKDISTTMGQYEDWGIMGLAYKPGRSCVVSTLRVKRSAKSEKHINERLRKVTLHEFGHTFGLPHCENSKTCLMRDANGKVSTVDEVSDFCDKCKMEIKDHLK